MWWFNQLFEKVHVLIIDIETGSDAGKQQISIGDG